MVRRDRARPFPGTANRAPGRDMLSLFIGKLGSRWAWIVRCSPSTRQPASAGRPSRRSQGPGGGWQPRCGGRRRPRRTGRSAIGRPILYLDQTPGAKLKDASDRSRWYNHPTFADLVVMGLVGLVTLRAVWEPLDGPW